jgi:hypothetical protein
LLTLHQASDVNTLLSKGSKADVTSSDVLAWDPSRLSAPDCIFHAP